MRLSIITSFLELQQRLVAFCCGTASDSCTKRKHEVG